MAMMYSGRKTFAGTPLNSIGSALRTASSVNPEAARNCTGKSFTKLALDARSSANLQASISYSFSSFFSVGSGGQ
jgi:hypothetical protein